MKKILFFVYAILISCVTYSQNKVSFSEIDQGGFNLHGSFKSYKILEIDENVHSISDGKILAFNYQKDYDFVLKENRLTASDYSVKIKNENGVETKSIFDLGFDGKYYTNANASADNQLALSIYRNQYTIFIKKNDREFYIEPLNKFEKNAPEAYYVYYEVKDMISNGGVNCGVEDKNQPGLISTSAKTVAPNSTCKVIDLNFCVDYSFYATYGSINDIINRTFEILNLSQLDYSIANGLAYDVSFKVKKHYIITCNTCNYWPITGDIYTNHIAFQYYSNYSPMFDEASDIKVFWQAALPPNNYNGYGVTPGDTFCTTLPIVTIRTASVKNFISATGTNLTRLVLSHEIGHNLNCEHTSSGSIMAGCCYEGNTWAPNSIAAINNSLTVSNCHYDCMSELCYNTRIEDLEFDVNDTDNIVNLNWTSEAGIEYKARLYNYTTNTWTDYSTINYPEHTIAYSYQQTTACNKYKIEITPFCSGTIGIADAIVFTISDTPTQSLSFVSPVQNEPLCLDLGLPYTFVVNGINLGSNPVYQWKLSDIIVGSNSASFTTDALQDFDVLSCTATSNEICIFSPSATISRVIRGMHPSLCELSNNQFEKDNLEYFPNPVKDRFTVKSFNNIKRINIYNLLGQKLAEQSVNSNETVLDFSHFANSTYLLSIEFDNQSKTIKILKL